MNIIDLINRAGIENVKVQPLHDSAIHLSRRKYDSELTFATSHEFAQAVLARGLGEKTKIIGLVLWLPDQT